MIIAISKDVFASVSERSVNEYGDNQVNNDVYTGSCGENLAFTLDCNGTLIISGTGPMYDYDDVVFSGKNYSPWYGSRFNVKKIIIEDGVTAIGDNAFVDMEKLEEVSIPKTVTELGTNAFYSCISLSGIVIPDSVIKMGESCFWWCTGLTSVSLSRNLTVIPKYAFLLSYNLREIEIPDSVHCIELQAFYGCTWLEKLVIPSTVEKIDPSATENCPNLAIYGKAGTYAEKYAIQYNIPFVSDEKYTVTFQYDDGTIISQQLIQYGHDAVAPNSPSKKGTEQYEYVFLGWDKKFTNVRSDLVVNALYQERIREYIVTFDATNGSIPDPDMMLVGYGSQLGELPKCTRSGYQFRGWYTDPKKGAEVTATTEVKENMVVYAHWHSVKPTKVKVTLGHKIGRLPQISFNTYLGNVSGYEIQYSTSEDYSSDDTEILPIKEIYKLSKILRGTCNGKNYYVRARAISYEKDSTGNYVYGDWSDSIKI